MTSLTLPEFWVLYRALPADVRRSAQRAYHRFAVDPTHPGLRFRELNGFPGYWYVRISLSYRAVGRRDGDAVVWFWIGSHAEFDRDFG